VLFRSGKSLGAKDETGEPVCAGLIPAFIFGLLRVFPVCVFVATGRNAGGNSVGLVVVNPSRT